MTLKIETSNNDILTIGFSNCETYNSFLRGILIECNNNLSLILYKHKVSDKLVVSHGEHLYFVKRMKIITLKLIKNDTYNKNNYT